jgi:hypothetical protein
MYRQMTITVTLSGQQQRTQNHQVIIQNELGRNRFWNVIDYVTQ